MDTGRIRSELWKSVRIVATDERWILAGPLVAAVAYAIWIGATGAALSYLGPMAGVSLAVDPWTGTTTALAVLVAVLWVLAPAAVATLLVDRQLRNHRGNLRLCYRLGHPAVLLVPPALLLCGAVAALVELAAAPVAVQAALVAAGAFLLVRTVAYGYRVVSFSSPRMFQGFLSVGAAALAVTVLVGAATAAGRREFLAAVGTGLGETTGVAGVRDVLVGTVDVAGVAVPATPALATLVLVGLSTGYVAVQSLVGLSLRIRKPTVPRSQLRTGQRFPWFLKPGASRTDSSPTSTPTSASASAGSTSSSSSTSGSSAPAGTAATGTDGGAVRDRSSPGVVGSPSGSPSTTDTQADAEADGVAATGSAVDDTDEDDIDEAEAVSHTKVFSPEDDLDGGPTGGGSDSGGDASGGGETPVSDEVVKRCPACGEEYGRDVTASFCPNCGARLDTV